ncbi:MAG: hypothetical protein RR326_08195 [Stenotrophomonas sp.]
MLPELMGLHAQHLLANYRITYAFWINLMKHASIDQLKVLIDSLDDISLDADSRIEILQKIRRSAASLYFNGSNNSVDHCDQIDVMVLAAIEVALLPFEREPLGHSNAAPLPAAEYIQP